MQYSIPISRSILPLALLLTLLSPVSATAQQASSASSTRVIEEIIVKARRSSESLQDAPLAVSAFTGETLENIGVNDLGGLENIVPNLSLNVGDASNAIIYIRGIGQRDSLSFADPGVAVYLDDVYLGRAQGSFLEILDVEHIEVLRGPQGTLYGRNTIGGAVKYLSAVPEREPGGRLRASAGSNSLRSLRGMLNTPLGEQLSARFNFGLIQRDGFAENLADGEDDGDKKLGIARAQLLWDNDDKLNIHFSADYSKNQPDTSVTPSIEAVGLVGTLVGIEDASDDPFKVNANFNNREELTTWGTALTVSWAISDAATIKSITSYREVEHETFLDLDGDDGHYFGVFVHQEQDQFSQELQALLDFDNDLRMVAGLYYFQENDVTPDGVFGADANISFFGIEGLTQGLSTASTNDLETESWAVFGELNKRFRERWELTLGARYTHDEKSSTRIYDASTGFGNPDVQLTDLADASQGPAPFRSAGNKTFNAFTPKFGLSYQAGENTLLYVNASRGFKSGGFNGRARDDNEAAPFDEEVVTAFEGGLKSTLYNGRMTFNAAVFRNDYKDMQLSSFGSANASFIAIFTNAGEAVTQGIEMELEAAPSDSLQLRAHLGYLDADYKEYNAPNLGDGSVMDLSHLDLIQAPEYTYGVSFDWLMIENGAGRFSLNGQYSGVSSYYTTVMNEESLKEDGYRLLNLNLHWESSDSRWSAVFAARNLTDEEYIIHGFDILSYPGVALAYYGEPATYEFSVNMNF